VPVSPRSYYANPPFVQALVTPEPGGVAKCARPNPNPESPNPVGFLYSCYGPKDIRSIYNIPDPLTSGINGAGQTIVIVDAFGDPTIQQDLNAFNALFNLPPANLTIVQPYATDPTADPADVVGWAGETALDVEWAHALAPAARIVLAVAPSDNSRALNQIQRLVIPKYPGAIVSLSFGNDETFVRDGLIDEIGQHALLELAKALGDTVVVAAGDLGATGVAGVTGVPTGPVAEYPASDPLVLSVGGTQSNPYVQPDPFGVSALGLLVGGTTESPAGGYGGEETWNEALFGFAPPGATGGAPSMFFPAPSWQAAASGNTHRTVPDVAWNAAVAGGVITVVGGVSHVTGGTSAAAPQWAAVIALADQARAKVGKPRLGFVNDDLYAIYNNPVRYAADFHDILASPEFQGFPENAVAADANGNPIGFSAGKGYDLTTGLGTPNVDNLLSDLVAAGSPGRR
jgi:subtilase family serine protease